VESTGANGEETNREDRLVGQLVAGVDVYTTNTDILSRFCKNASITRIAALSMRRVAPGADGIALCARNRITRETSEKKRKKVKSFSRFAFGVLAPKIRFR